MNIVVCIKQVPDTNEVRIDKETNNLVRQGVPSILNPFDENGVEEALRLRDQHGGKVTVVSMGPPQAEKALRYCLEMGADEAVLLSDRAVGGSDTLATGYALSMIIRSLEYDLIICGNEAIDGCTGQVGPIIAGNLGITQLTCVRSCKLSDGELHIQREVGSYIELYTAKTPCLICVHKSINEPRARKQTNKCVKTVSAADVSIDTARVGNGGSPTNVVKIDMSGVRANSYFDVDDSLPWEARIQYIIDGGMERKKVELWRGSAKTLAERVMQDANGLAKLEL